MTPFLRAAACGIALLLPAAMPSAAEIRLPEFSRSELPNGAVVLLAEKHDVPLIALEISVRGGSLADPAGRDGTASVLAELMQKGAGERDAAAFAEAIDAVGGRLSIDAGRSALTLSAEFLADDAGLMIELAADALQRPRLAEAEFEKVRERALKSLVAAKDGGPDRLIASYGNAWLFGEHPYGRPSGGSEASLAAIRHADLLAYQRDQLGGDRLIIAVVGAFDAAEMKARIERAFGSWRAAAAPLPTVEARPRERGRRVLLVDKPGATQTYFWLGNVGVSRTDPARVAQNLANTLFGGRFTSMLNSELRIRTGLTYGARAGFSRLPQPGAFAISSFTRTDATTEAIELAIATLARLHAEGLDAGQLDSGRNYMLGQFPPTLETAPQLASQLAALELHGLGRDEIDGFASAVRAVDADAARAALAAFPAPDDLVIVLIGDAAKIRDAAKKLGPVTEMPLSAPTFRPM